jgi:hypothetical protein
VQKDLLLRDLTPQPCFAHLQIRIIHGIEKKHSTSTTPPTTTKTTKYKQPKSHKRANTAKRLAPCKGEINGPSPIRGSVVRRLQTDYLWRFILQEPPNVDQTCLVIWTIMDCNHSANETAVDAVCLGGEAPSLRTYICSALFLVKVVGLPMLVFAGRKCSTLDLAVGA